ncbi:MBL fold metallo-hydrolase [Pseudoflavitalea sp. X16]|uniref:MBL fold metallo-hydrolase n=1 Tax=Paraflavitalea devenefica TaxID=2716334 RepID=UPI001423A4CA|nr:MBL fold metallo-hydrolase [Paraflavitalea devenefica]NII29187.1 MBL fold metallo-hydrolase [Paraflavitalea devenefica]
MKIYLLDMGSVMYGDCLVITQGAKSILIDGGHQGDYNSILRQLRKIFEKDGPYEFDLLIVTHCHDDHIGCLHNLVGNGDIIIKKALLADPKYRWSQNGELDAEEVEPFIDALFEEDRLELDDAELEQFLFDAELLPVRYDRMIKDLKKARVPVKLYQGTGKDSYTALEKEFKSFGLKILGPTHNQLKITQTSLQKTVRETKKFIEQIPETDAIQTEVDLYRRIFSQPVLDNILLLDAKKNKGAINDQSIVIKVSEPGFSALLAGDMQFAEPEVEGLEEEMSLLLDVVNKAGPYDFIKTAHHTSNNGLNETIFDYWLKEGTTLIAHSGGKKDDKHPEKTVLKFLEERKERFEFARTDRNGIITIAKNGAGKVVMEVEKKKTDIFTPNPNPVKTDEAAPAVSSAVAAATAGTVIPADTPPKQSSLVSAQLTTQSNRITVTASFAIGAGPVTFTIDTEKKNNGRLSEEVSRDVKQPGGRFQGLLFVANLALMTQKFKEAGVKQVIDLINKMPGARLYDVPFEGNCVDTAEAVHKQIRSDTKGIVLVGGYDVLPSLQFNLLNENIRNAVRKEIFEKRQRDDPDNFIIWSDDIYGDTEGDFLPEYPVSRIPDGNNIDTLLSALSAASFSTSARFGIHNFRRPFAVDIFEKIPYTLTSKLEASELFESQGNEEVLAKGAVYFMLHGSEMDATRFTGERNQRGRYLDAFELNNVPKSCNGTVVFSGCCWGGLIVRPIAQYYDPNIPVRSRTHKDSIVMAYLHAGANAFIGCTGAHYSPAKARDNFFGKPMHDAFWTELKKGTSPAEALFLAKKIYSVNIPHGLEDSALTTAVEFKSMHQFTCLGLGW